MRRACRPGYYGRAHRDCGFTLSYTAGTHSDAIAHNGGSRAADGDGDPSYGDRRAAYGHSDSRNANFGPDQHASPHG